VSAPSKTAPPLPRRAKTIGVDPPWLTMRSSSAASSLRLKVIRVGFWLPSWHGVSFSVGKVTEVLSASCRTLLPWSSAMRPLPSIFSDTGWVPGVSFSKSMSYRHCSVGETAMPLAFDLLASGEACLGCLAAVTPASRSAESAKENPRVFMSLFSPSIYGYIRWEDYN